jgi:hypothetical protein
MRKTIATICLVLLVLLCCGLSVNLYAGDHESYSPRTGAGGAVVGQANQMQVAEAVKFGSWIIYRYNKSTDMHSVVTTTSTSYNSSGIPSGTTVVTEETEYTLNYNPYDE